MSKEMRVVLAEKLDEIMAKNDKVVLMDADLARANGTLDVHKKYPNRSVDVGVAEANMASMAAGIASYGLIPVIATFCPFATRRICDQIAISIQYAGCNVKIIGTDPGISAELNGGTHMSFEDIGVLRSIPGIVIYEPVDAISLAASLEQIINYEGTVYIRMFRKTLPDIFTPDYKFDLFKADLLKEGTDVSIFASGILVYEAIKAAILLEQEGVSAEVISIHTIKPIDTQAIVDSVTKTRCAVTAENHNIIGGLYSAVCETLAGTIPTPVVPIGIKDEFGVVGVLPYLKEHFGLNAKEIATAVRKAISQKSATDV